MTAKAGLDSIVKWLLLCGWFALFIGGVIHYPGSWVVYTMFSIVLLAMLISGFYRQVSYGYLFFVVMLWLGFWFKLTVHLLADYPYVEPTGFFVGMPAAWDEVLWVATIGSIGVIAARLLYGLTGESSMVLAQVGGYKAPAWYMGVRKRMWAGMVFVCVGLAIINALLGILQIGLAPRTILLWPLNAVISWLIGYGLTFGVATLLWWDISLGRRITVTIYVVLIEAFASTISLLSRGAYIFHTIPQFLALYKKSELVSGWTRKNTTVLVGVFVILFAISNPLVNKLRDYYYSNVVFSWKGADGGASALNGAGGGASALAKFAVDRWIGVEGVMAASAYPNKSGDLFVRALTERREIGKSTIYQEICQSHYRHMDMKKFQFASLPGAVGFLYFTGYLWVVALGMVVLVLVMLGSEGLVFRFTSNPLLAALWGGIAANSVAQIGVDTRGLLIYFFEMSCGIAAIYFIQSEWFSKMMQKLGALRTMKS